MPPSAVPTQKLPSTAWMTLEIESEESPSGLPKLVNLASRNIESPASAQPTQRFRSRSSKIQSGSSLGSPFDRVSSSSLWPRILPMPNFSKAIHSVPSISSHNDSMRSPCPFHHVVILPCAQRPTLPFFAPIQTVPFWPIETEFKGSLCAPSHLE